MRRKSARWSEDPAANGSDLKTTGVDPYLDHREGESKGFPVSTSTRLQSKLRSFPRNNWEMSVSSYLVTPKTKIYTSFYSKGSYQGEENSGLTGEDVNKTVTLNPTQSFVSDVRHRVHSGRDVLSKQEERQHP